MKTDALQDVKTQDRLRADLDGKLRMAIFDAIEGGLKPDLALKAVEDVCKSERSYAETRAAFARTYI